ncbi:MAG: diguanylate cyclase [Candidatus Limnocylindria bacterium]
MVGSGPDRYGLLRMGTALTRPAGAPSSLRPWRSAALVRARRIFLGRGRGKPLRDPFFLYTAAITPIALTVALIAREPQDLPTVLLLSPICIGLQAMFGSIPSRFRPMTRQGWSFMRLVVTLIYVAALAELVGGPTHPMLSLYIPVVVAAAALGTRQAIVILLAAALIYLAPELTIPGSRAAVALRGLTHAGVSILVAVGTRRLVIAVEQTTAKLRAAMVSERRRSRQIAGMEAVSQLLVSGGPLPQMLDGALGVLVDQFHYAYVSIYLLDGDRLVLGSQRGYDHPRESFDGTEGVVGRVMRGHETAFVPDVSIDPDYVAVDLAVVSEICAPLLYDGEFLGILNVEATSALDRTDRDLSATLAGRIATVVALGRDRQALGERAAVLRSLSDFTNAVSGELDMTRLGAAMVDAVRKVVPADIVSLTVLERETGRYLMRAATEIDSAILDREIKPGEGLAGRAIRDRTVVIDDNFGPDRYPTAYVEIAEPDPLLGAGIPLQRDGVVVGAIAILRRDRSDPFRPIDLEAMELLAGHAALAISNAFLHAEVEQLATHDPLTGLYNRRYFDEALKRVVASWRRALQADRRPVAAIMFDLDHFGEFNKQHGHQVGDEVLRTFARVLRSRFRETDLVARFGGEEFVAVLEGATRDKAVEIADQVRGMLAERSVLGDDGTRLTVTVSAGCAELDESEASREQLLRTADVGLFMAKRAGRNRVVAA